MRTSDGRKESGLETAVAPSHAVAELTDPDIDDDRRLLDARVTYQVAGRIFASENQMWWSRMGVFVSANTILASIVSVLVTRADSIAAQSIATLMSLLGLWSCRHWELIFERSHTWVLRYIARAKEIEALFHPDAQMLNRIAQPDGKSSKQRSKTFIRGWKWIYAALGIISVTSIVANNWLTITAFYFGR
jgi:hypothetical protein